MPEAWKRWEGHVVNEEFQLLRYLGGSENSAVFFSRRDHREPQEVAVKLILANAENPELQLSWWELGAKFSHPHLLRLFQWGRCQLEDTELLYAVTEYAEESLAQIIPYRPLAPAEAREMLQSVLEALAYIHGKGFVHGHIKPANVMAVGDQIKLSSDGLCGAGESSRVLGKPGTYAAPEIADGGGMSPASDVWSLGIMLVEALTQHPPASSGVEQGELVLPETMPEPFFDIASHCLRRNPQRRWTVAEIAAQLQQPAPARRREEIIERKKGFAKPGYLVPAIVVALLLLVIFGSKLFHRNPSAEPEPSTRAESSIEQVPAQPEQIPNKTGQAPSISAPSNASPVAPNNFSARVQGAVAHQVLPDVSRSALRTIHGKVKVRVKVTVDASGNVLGAKFDSRGPSKYFADRALEAARLWKFTPPQARGQSVPSEWILKFEFERSGSNVHSAQTSP
jgi:TonB family protein